MTAEVDLTPRQRAVIDEMERQWAEGAARASEGFCADCSARLRPLTVDEQAKADGWWAEPFAVCTACWCVHSRPRPGRPEYPMLLSGLSWHSCSIDDPFRLRHDVCPREATS